MYILLMVITLLYILINLIIPANYLKILIQLRKSLLEFNMDQNYSKPLQDKSLNSNNNSKISPRNSISLDIIDNK